LISQSPCCRKQPRAIWRIGLDEADEAANLFLRKRRVAGQIPADRPHQARDRGLDRRVGDTGIAIGRRCRRAMQITTNASPGQAKPATICRRQPGHAIRLRRQQATLVVYRGKVATGAARGNRRDPLGDHIDLHHRAAADVARTKDQRDRR